MLCLSITKGEEKQVSVTEGRTAGDGDPEFRFLYSDDSTPERAVLEFDRKGIVASVKQDRGSHFEGFISSTDSEPIFRLNSYPGMRLEMGDGGSSPVDVAIQRESTETLTFITGPTEQMRIASDGNVGIGTTDPENKLHVNGAINLDSIAEPANPTTGFVLYVDTADGDLKAKSNNGTITTIAGISS